MTNLNQAWRVPARSGGTRAAPGPLEDRREGDCLLGPAGCRPYEAFRSELHEHSKGHSQALESLAIEMLARGLSVCDIEDTFKDEASCLLLSKTADSELGERLWANYRKFATRD